jgi:hypothetical protein
VADKYLILGAAYNGDGTSSAEAASNGAAGAWNQQSILTNTAPTYGSLAAGDIVYIRSKTGGGANADIVIALSSATTIGNANATRASSISWVIDQGVTWSGVVGSLWFTAATGSYSLTFRSHNHWRCTDNTKFGYRLTTAVATDGFVYMQDNVALVGFTREVTGTFATYPGYLSLSGNGIRVYLENCKVKQANTTNSGLFYVTTESFAVLVNFEAEITDVNSAGSVFAGGYNCRNIVIGGRAYGNGVRPGNAIYAWGGSGSTATSFELIGFQVPEGVGLTNGVPGLLDNQAIRGIGLDDNLGAYATEPWGNADSRGDGNYPNLNATLPDSVASGWSWFVYPSAASVGHPATLRLLKLYTNDAATQKVTLELMVANGYAADLNKDNVFLVIKFISNSTGLPVYQSTRVYGSTSGLDAGSSSWTATTYGGTSCVAKKLELTTTESVKKDTPVTAALIITKNANTSTKFLFVCPDLQFSTP